MGILLQAKSQSHQNYATNTLIKDDGITLTRVRICLETKHGGKVIFSCMDSICKPNEFTLYRDELCIVV